LLNGDETMSDNETIDSIMQTHGDTEQRTLVSLGEQEEALETEVRELEVEVESTKDTLLEEATQFYASILENDALTEAANKYGIERIFTGVLLEDHEKENRWKAVVLIPGKKYELREGDSQNGAVYSPDKKREIAPEQVARMMIKTFPIPNMDSNYQEMFLQFIQSDLNTRLSGYRIGEEERITGEKNLKTTPLQNELRRYQRLRT